ncbi:MAG: type IV secretion system protein [Synergistaceae bacterium]|nr:type IV secretion system protein [Synergistaceae bacterium]
MSLFSRKGKHMTEKILPDGENMPLSKQPENEGGWTSQGVALSDAERSAIESFAKTPWLNSKKRYTDIYQALASSVSQWRIATFTMLLLLVFSVVGNITLALSVRIQPYVIQVDEHGYAIPIKKADISGVDQRIVTSQVGLFIVDSRTRLLDREAQLIFAEDAYRCVAAASAAERKLNDYFRASPPTQAKFPVMVEIRSIIPISKNTYRARWVESTAGETSGIVTNTYEGILTVAVSPPTNLENILTNPMGVYVMDFTVQESTNMN